MVDGCTLARPAVADDERVGVGGAGEDCGAVQRCRIHEGAAVIAGAAVVVQHFAAVKQLDPIRGAATSCMKTDVKAAARHCCGARSVEFSLVMS